MTSDCERDAFRHARQTNGVIVGDFRGEKVPMVLRYRDVRAAAKDWPTFSSDAPGRVPVPDETDVRPFRQLPIETDPPDHTDFRELVEPFFRRPTQPDVIERIEDLVCRSIDGALAVDVIDVVGAFALPLQSRALTIMLNVPESEADEWIGWGIHAFRVDGVNIPEKAAILEDYITRNLDRAAQSPGDDFFSALVTAEFRGRPLTRMEMIGYANLAFAGGRDTVIHLVSGAIAHLAERPEALAALRADPDLAVSATEEFVRFISPLTHIGRVCTRPNEVHGVAVDTAERISLCWASANYDETIFEAPETVRLDRKPNPHVGFGSGVHSCLGAPLARRLLRTLLVELPRRVDRLELLEAKPTIQSTPQYQRALGYETLKIAFDAGS